MLMPRQGVSIRMMIKEDPLSFAPAVAIRHGVKRKPPDGKPYVDYLKQHGYTAEDVYRACLKFKEDNGRWPIDQELCGLVEHTPNSMHCRAAGRLFDQTMEEVRHWDWEYCPDAPPGGVYYGGF